MSLVVTSEPHDGATVVRLRGDIDMNTCGRLRTAVEGLFAEPGGDVVLDLGQVGFLDSSGLGTLIGLQKRANQEQRRLVLSHLTPGIRKVFDVTRLSDAFTIAAEDGAPPTT